MTMNQRQAAANSFGAMDARDYDHAGTRLTHDSVVDWPDSHERMTRDQWIQVNAEYPGDWAAVREQVVATDTVVVSVTRVFARTSSGPVLFVVSFFQFQAAGICGLTEYWSDVVLDAPRSAARVARGLSPTY